MAASVIAFSQTSPSKAGPDANRFGEEYLARLRRCDDDTVRHFHDHFRRLILLKLWGQFSRERGEELAGEVMAAVREKIAAGEPRAGDRLPAYIFGICAGLARQAARMEVQQGRRVTREGLRLFFLRRKAK